MKCVSMETEKKLKKEIMKRYDGKTIKLKCNCCGWIGFNNQAIYTLDRDGSKVLCCPINRCYVEDFIEELECLNRFKCLDDDNTKHKCLVDFDKDYPNGFYEDYDEYEKGSCSVVRKLWCDYL